MESRDIPARYPVPLADIATETDNLPTAFGNEREPVPVLKPVGRIFLPHGYRDILVVWPLAGQKGHLLSG